MNLLKPVSMNRLINPGYIIVLIRSHKFFYNGFPISNYFLINRFEIFRVRVVLSAYVKPGVVAGFFCIC